MVLEGLAYFGIYRMIVPYSPKYAHSYRTGILGYLIFGACGFHIRKPLDVLWFTLGGDPG